MATYTDKNKDAQQSSAAKSISRSTGQLFKLNDNRTEAAQQQKIINSINGSPLMVAQRKTIQRVLGNTAKKSGSEQDAIQKKSTDTLQLEGLKDEEVRQGKFIGVHQLEGLKDEEVRQGKFESPSSTHGAAIQKIENNSTGLPNNLKSGVENLSGVSLDQVKVHYNSSKPAQLNALAYAQGSDIHVASGQEKHLPHEAWHVVQQMQGRVQPTVQMEGVSINDDVSLETEADVMGAKALS